MSEEGGPKSEKGGNEGLLRRWSRRKRAALAPAPMPAPEIAEVPEAELPLIEELGQASDYTAFLQKGVAAAVQQRALARAWASDAAIADFRGMAEYAWDFNAPRYGMLWPVDDVAKLLRDVVAPPAWEARPANAPAVVAEPLPEPAMAALADPSAQGDESLPAHREEPPVAVSNGKRHGSALPT